MSADVRTFYGLDVVGPTRALPVPTATFTCPCGHVERARGVQEVQALTGAGVTRHREVCPLRVETGRAA
ncbi:hypothetical protein [Streptomyces sp. WMMB303]|uniref:hypothetical protein n=1 Tax=Streptomyces sp. WMMB303 TaxID=3034154 RepID=UPI0023ECC666|nr:hypothetical protein [Streptomyces sp. WMMB303]MDF4254717.1 hypothetical protein [Streptomyces sp. WMMB303]